MVVRSQNGKSIVVEATIKLLATEMGGRAAPITKGYRPNHNFGDAENRDMFIGQLDLDDGDWLHPGDTRDLRITFLDSGDLASWLTRGVQWRLQDGGQLVGWGTLNRIVRRA